MNLFSIHDPTGAVAACPRREPRFRAFPRLAPGDRAPAAPRGRERRQDPRRLLRRAQLQRRGRQEMRSPQRDRRAGVAERELLVDEASGQLIQAEATARLGHVDQRQPQRVKPVAQLPGNTLTLVDAQPGSDRFRRKLSYRLPDQLLVFGHREADHQAPSPCTGSASGVSSSGRRRLSPVSTGVLSAASRSRIRASRAREASASSAKRSSSRLISGGSMR